MSSLQERKDCAELRIVAVQLRQLLIRQLPVARRRAVVVVERLRPQAHEIPLRICNAGLLHVALDHAAGIYDGEAIVVDAGVDEADDVALLIDDRAAARACLGDFAADLVDRCAIL